VVQSGDRCHRGSAAPLGDFKCARAQNLSELICPGNREREIALSNNGMQQPSQKVLRG